MYAESCVTIPEGKKIRKLEWGVQKRDGHHNNKLSSSGLNWYQSIPCTLNGLEFGPLPRSFMADITMEMALPSQNDGIRTLSIQNPF